MSDSNHPSRAKIYIDRLVLRGVDSHHAGALVESLKQQLALTFSDPVQRRQLQHVSGSPVLRLGRIPLAAGRAGARDFGAKVARAIGKQMTGARSGTKGAAQ
jgi:hypothetical protein